MGNFRFNIPFLDNINFDNLTNNDIDKIIVIYHQCNILYLVDNRIIFKNDYCFCLTTLFYNCIYYKNYILNNTIDIQNFENEYIYNYLIGTFLSNLTFDEHNLYELYNIFCKIIKDVEIHIPIINKYASIQKYHEYLFIHSILQLKKSLILRRLHNYIDCKNDFSYFVSQTINLYTNYNTTHQ